MALGLRGEIKGITPGYTGVNELEQILNKSGTQCLLCLFMNFIQLNYKKQEKKEK